MGNDYQNMGTVVQIISQDTSTQCPKEQKPLDKMDIPVNGFLARN